jgi:probable HAF family extracellular repeat protein
MRRADPSLRTVNRRISRTIFVALVVGAIALLGLGTRPAETQETSAQSLSYKVQDLGTLGGSYSAPSSINEAGKVVGASSTRRDLQQHAFLYSGGEMTDLGTLGGSYSQASDINNTDKVVGVALFSSPTRQHAFLYSDGVWTDLGSLGGSSQANDINDADKVVGYAYTSGDAGLHPFLYSGGVMQDLTSLVPDNTGWDLQVAVDINDKDQIAGYGYNKKGALHTFLLTPKRA